MDLKPFSSFLLPTDQHRSSLTWPARSATICLHFSCLSNPKFISPSAPGFSWSLSLCLCCLFLPEYPYYQTLITFIYLFKTPFQVLLLPQDFSDMYIPISTKHICISILQCWFIYLCLLHYINKSLKQKNISSNLLVNLFAQPSNTILIHQLVTPGITLVQDSIFPLAYHNSFLTYTLATSQPGVLFILRSDDVSPFLKILITAPPLHTW